MGKLEHQFSEHRESADRRLREVEEQSKHTQEALKVNRILDFMWPRAVIPYWRLQQDIGRYERERADLENSLRDVTLKLNDKTMEATEHLNTIGVRKALRTLGPLGWSLSSLISLPETP